MEKIDIFSSWYRLNTIATAGAATLIGITMLANVWALDSCRAPTPCPCVADGVCRPNVLKWGYSQTRWRTWPGESMQAGAAPDSADPQLELPPFQRPTPEDEDLRGPAKTTSDRPDGAAGAADAGEILGQPQGVPVQPFEAQEQPLGLPAQPQPGQPLPEQPQQVQPEEGDFPDFELQGFQDDIPIQLNDAPPTLPTSLRLGSGRHQGIQRAVGRIIQPKRVGVIRRTSLQQPAQPIRLPQISNRPQPVVQANVDMSKRLELVNPAAGNLIPESKLKGAVFYESLDLPPSFSSAK